MEIGNQCLFGNGPVVGECRIDWIPLHRGPPRYHLFFVGSLDPFVGTYFLLPIRNLSPIYVTTQSPGPFRRVVHAPWHLILFEMFDITPLRGQIVPPLVYAPCLHVFSVFVPAMWTPERTQWISSRHDLPNILMIFSPCLSLCQTTTLQEIPTDGANCASPTQGLWAKLDLGSQLICMVGLDFLAWVVLGRVTQLDHFSLFTLYF